MSKQNEMARTCKPARNSIGRVIFGTRDSEFQSSRRILRDFSNVSELFARMRCARTIA